MTFTKDHRQDAEGHNGKPYPTGYFSDSHKSGLSQLGANL